MSWILSSLHHGLRLGSSQGEKYIGQFSLESLETAVGEVSWTTQQRHIIRIENDYNAKDPTIDDAIDEIIIHFDGSDNDCDTDSDWKLQFLLYFWKTVL